MKNEMTKIQFDTILRLARAYGHEWACELDFDRAWAPGTKHETTRGAVYRADAADPTNEYRAQWAAWVDLYDRIEAGHVPTCGEIERLATPLFDGEHFPTTCWVALAHETCTHRTRWDVRTDGSVRFEFISDSPVYSADPPRRLLAIVYSFVRPDGTRDASIEISAPIAEWGGDHAERVRRALSAIGCTAAVIDGAFCRAKLVLDMRLLTHLTVHFDGPDSPGRGFGQWLPICPPRPTDAWSGCALQWDGQRVSVVASWGPSPFGTYGSAAAVAARFGLITDAQFEDITAFDRRSWAAYDAAEKVRGERRRPVPPTSRIVGGTRRRRNARRRVSQ